MAFVLLLYLSFRGEFLAVRKWVPVSSAKLCFVQIDMVQLGLTQLDLVDQSLFILAANAFQECLASGHTL